MEERAFYRNGIQKITEGEDIEKKKQSNLPIKLIKISGKRYLVFARVIKQKQTHRDREQTDGCQMEGELEGWVKKVVIC